MGKVATIHSVAPEGYIFPGYATSLMVSATVVEIAGVFPWSIPAQGNLLVMPSASHVEGAVPVQRATEPGSFRIRDFPDSCGVIPLFNLTP